MSVLQEFITTKKTLMTTYNKKKKTTTTKRAMSRIKNTTNLMKTSQPIFYKNKITFGPT